MPTILLRAEVGDRPPDVLLVDDPEHALRAVALLDGGLERSKLIADHRGLPAFRGRWAGHPVTIQTTGVGAPAVAMVVEELLMTGARRFLRAAPAAAVSPSLHKGEAIVVVSASAMDGTSRTYLRGLSLAPTADFSLTTSLAQSAQAAGLRINAGRVVTVDVLPDTAGRRELAALGILAADLGSAPLFILTARADALAQTAAVSVRAAAILWIDQSHRAERPFGDEAALDLLLSIALDALSGTRAAVQA